MHKHKQIFLGLIVTLSTAMVFIPAMAGAQSLYVVGQSVRNGMLVSATSNTGVVAPATNANASSLVGVLNTTAVVDPLQQPGQQNIQTDGVVTTLVSTENGPILAGDKIGTSALMGIGAKSTKSGWILGIAQASVDAHTTGAVPSQITDSAGHAHTVYVAAIPVLIKIAYYVLPQTPQKKSLQTSLSDTIQKAADALAGRHVDQHAVILGFILLLVGLILSGIIINAAIRNGIRGIARQPLAKHEVQKSVFRSVLLGVGILVVAFGAAALVVRVL